MNAKMTISEIAWLVFAIPFVGGYIANIVKLISMVGGDVTTMFILRIVGIPFVPIGAVLGYL